MHYDAMPPARVAIPVVVVKCKESDDPDTVHYWERKKEHNKQ